MSTTQPSSSSSKTRTWRRVGFVALIAAPFLAAIPSLAAMWQDGVLFESIWPAWVWLLLVGPPVILGLIAVYVTLLHREPGQMPALDRTPREAVVVRHRIQSTGDNRATPVTTVEYRATDGRPRRADLLEELTSESARALPSGNPSEIYAFQNPKYARIAVFLTEKHDDLMRKGHVVRWGADRNARFADGPVAGSPFLRSEAGEVFA